MEYKIGEILSVLEEKKYTYTFVGNPAQRITGFSDPACYHAETAIWLGATKYLKLTDGLQFSDVALLFCTPDMEGAEQFPNRILCADPRNTFMELVELLAEQTAPQPQIMETAIVSPKATIGEGVSIGHYCVIEEDVVIGDHTRIGNYVVIHKGTRLGRDCVILDQTVIGNPGYGFRKLPDGDHKRFPHLGRVLIGDQVEIGSQCNIDKGTFRDTIIHDGVKIDSHSLIGHNVTIGKNSLIIASAVGGNCTLGEDVEMIGSRSKNRLTIGSGTKIGIGSVVITDMPENTVCFGNPARIIRNK